MSRPLAILLLCLLLPALPPARGEAIHDIVYRPNGTTLAGKIIDAADGFVRMEIELAEDRRGTIAIPFTEIERATFAPNPEQITFLQTASFNDLPRLRTLWAGRRDLLRIEGSDAPAIGLALARELREAPQTSLREEALELYRQIETNARLPADLSDARQGRLRTLIALDRADEAVQEAQLLLEETEDPAVLIEARFVLAEAARVQFESLVEENPRWQEDLFVRPERNRLYHEIIDLYLYPFLFQGTQQAATSRSLGRLLSFLIATGDLPEARAIAADLLALYTDQPEADAAREFLATQPASTTDTHHETS